VESNSGSEGEDNDGVQSSEEGDSDNESFDSSDDSLDSSGDESQEEVDYNSETEGHDAAPSSRAEIGSSWKNNLAECAARSFLDRETSTVNLQELIYGTSRNVTVVSEDDSNHNQKDGGESDDSDEEFFKVRGQGKEKSSSKSESRNVHQVSLLGEEDSSHVQLGGDGSLSFDSSPWLQDGENCLMESIRNKFVTGKWESAEMRQMKPLKISRILKLEKRSVHSMQLIPTTTTMMILLLVRQMKRRQELLSFNVYSVSNYQKRSL
jgi:ribosome biogenesis protein BMS1